MKFTISTLIFYCIVLLSCSKTDQVEGDPNSWIVELESIYDYNGEYILDFLPNDESYLAIGTHDIIEISKEGMLLSYKSEVFSEETFRSDMRLHNGKIYSFSGTFRFADYTPEDKVTLNIYTTLGDLIESIELNTVGMLFDVEIESDDIYGMLLYDPINRTMTVKRIDKEKGVLHESILDTTGTSPTNLHIDSKRNYLCTASSNDNNFHYLDNSLKSIVTKTFRDRTISDAEVMDGVGIYVTGSVAFSDENYIALISFEGEIINEVSFESDDRWISDLILNEKEVVISESAGEENLDFRLSCFNSNLELNYILNTSGYFAGSNMVINENNGVTFMNGIKTDSIVDTFYSLSHPRFFKLNSDCREPQTYIIQ